MLVAAMSDLSTLLGLVWVLRPLLVLQVAAGSRLAPELVLLLLLLMRRLM
jgi:hypothetical protein